MINVQNIDVNECFKWCLVRYLNPAGHNPRRITKADKDFAKRLDFENIKFTIKFKVIHQIAKNNSLALAFWVMKIKKNIQYVYQKML